MSNKHLPQERQYTGRRQKRAKSSRKYMGSVQMQLLLVFRKWKERLRKYMNFVRSSIAERKRPNMRETKEKKQEIDLAKSRTSLKIFGS